MAGAHSDDEYETSDASDEMTYSDMETRSKIYGGKYSLLDAPSPVRRYLERPRSPDESDSGISGVNGAANLAPTATHGAAQSAESNVSAKKIKVGSCAAKELFARISGDSYDGDVSLRSAVLCYDCTGCELLRKSRGLIDFGRVKQASLEGDTLNALQFWRRVDTYVGNIHWIASRASNDLRYLVARMLNKDAILQHKLMNEFRTNVGANFLKTSYALLGIPHCAVNAIQVEEIRLAEAIGYTMNHYREFTFYAELEKKLEALDVLDNLTKSMRILCEAEMYCRRQAADDGLL